MGVSGAERTVLDPVRQYVNVCNSSWAACAPPAARRKTRVRPPRRRPWKRLLNDWTPPRFRDRPPGSSSTSVCRSSSFSPDIAPVSRYAESYVLVFAHLSSVCPAGSARSPPYRSRDATIHQLHTMGVSKIPAPAINTTRGLFDLQYRYLPITNSYRPVRRVTW